MSNFPSLQAAKTVKYGSSVDGISTAEPEQYAKRWDAFFREQYAKIWEAFSYAKRWGAFFLRSSTQKVGTYFFFGARRKMVRLIFFWSRTHEGGTQFLRCRTQFFMAQYSWMHFYGSVCKKVRQLCLWRSMHRLIDSAEVMFIYITNKQGCHMTWATR